MGDFKDTWRDLGEKYPRVAEILLSQAGLVDTSVSPSHDFTEEEEKVLEFLNENMRKGSGDDLFEVFLEKRGGELGDDCRLTDREVFEECLDTMVFSGKLGRVPMQDGGFHYGSFEMCLSYLQRRSGVGEIEVGQLYRLEDRAGVPVEKLVREVLNRPRMSLTVKAGHTEAAEL